MQKLLQTVVAVGAAIIVTGLLLDEAGKGTFGVLVKEFAGKVTRGYGV